MEQSVSSPTSRSCTGSGKFTAAEMERIRAAADAKHVDVSTLVRTAVLRFLGDEIPAHSSDILLELFVRSMEAHLELRDRLTVAKFREICGQVKAEAVTW